MIRSQADRCRDILADLSQGGRTDEHMRRVPMSALISEAAEPHKDRGAHIITRFHGQLIDKAGPQPIVYRRPEVVHGLRNLIQNAVDFADTTIWIDIAETGKSLRVTVGDDGPGYPDDMLTQLGDPYVRSRSRKTKTPGAHEESEYHGMGLGLFIAKTLLEKSGARLTFASADRSVRRKNRGKSLEDRSPSGAVAAAVWRLEDVVVPDQEGRAALGENPKFTIHNV